MSLRRFYKFTLGKLIIFILSVGIPLFFIIEQMGIKDGQPLNPVWIYLTYILFWPFILFYFLESLIVPDIDWINLIDIPFLFIALVINLVYLYTITSLIYYLIEKVKLSL